MDGYLLGRPNVIHECGIQYWPIKPCSVIVHSIISNNNSKYNTALNIRNKITALI